MIRPQRIPSPLTRGDRTRFHQLHWAKLAVDWGTAATASALLWRHHWVAAAAIGFGPSIVTTAVFRSGRFDAALGRFAIGRARDLSRVDCRQSSMPFGLAV